MNAEEVKRLLPWYAVDALDAAERREVESELNRSAELRRELAQVRALGEAVRASDVEVPEFRAGLLDDALQRIDALEAANSDARPRATVTVLDRFRRTVTGDWNAASRVTRFALAAQFALIFVMAGFLLMPSKREENVYGTVSGPGVTTDPTLRANGRSIGPQSAAIQFSVRFMPDASAERIAAFLEGEGLQIVSGPSGQHAYVVTAAEGADSDATLAKLRAAQDIVRVANPVTP